MHVDGSRTRASSGSVLTTGGVLIGPEVLIRARLPSSLADVALETYSGICKILGSVFWA